jgi:hypothetical protein
LEVKETMANGHGGARAGAGRPKKLPGDRIGTAPTPKIPPKKVKDAPSYIGVDGKEGGTIHL